MTAVMRAKVKLNKIEKTSYGETLTFNAVAAKSYPTDGLDENNTYAKFSPSAEFKITVCNPALFGKLEIDKEYYVDFTDATPAPAEQPLTE